MKQPRYSPLPSFALGILALFPLSLGFWWFLGREYLIVILEKGTALITQWLMPEHVIGLTSQDSIWLVKTSLSPLNNPLILLAIPIYPIRITVSFPLFWALVLATPGAARMRQLLAGTLALFPIALLMLLLLIQFKLALYINHQPILTETPPGPYVLELPFDKSLYQLMGTGRQLALLVLPTLAPLLVWGILNRRFIRGVIFEGIFSRITKASLPPPQRDTAD